MKRKIRLTESEFHSLVRRLVIETKEEMNMNTYGSEDMDTYGSEDTGMEGFEDIEVHSMEENDYDPETVRTVARFFKKKLRGLDDDEIEDLQDMVINPETENLTEMFLREDISKRRKAFKEKAMIGGGLAMMGGGLLGMVSQAMGYTDQGELMIALHDYVEKMGGGAVSAGVLIAGLVMALKGMAKKSGY